MFYADIAIRRSVQEAYPFGCCVANIDSFLVVVGFYFTMPTCLVVFRYVNFIADMM